MHLKAGMFKQVWYGMVDVSDIRCMDWVWYCFVQSLSSYVPEALLQHQPALLKPPPG